MDEGRGGRNTDMDAGRGGRRMREVEESGLDDNTGRESQGNLVQVLDDNTGRESQGNLVQVLDDNTGRESQDEVEQTRLFEENRRTRRPIQILALAVVMFQEDPTVRPLQEALVERLVRPLQQALVERLPLPRVTITGEHISDINSITSSCTCYGDDFGLGEEVCQLYCGHIYHRNCITTWLRYGDTCPICRAGCRAYQ
jgi:hypothetical protein